MKTDQIRFENDRLELSVRRPTHFVTIFLVSAATLCIIAPLIIFAGMMIRPEEGFRIDTLTVALSLIPIVFGIYLLRIFVWNFFGMEVYSFDNEKLEFWSDFKFFKTEKKSFKINEIGFGTEHSGFENERKSILTIKTKKFKHNSKVELSEKDADRLIELLNQKLNQNKTIKITEMKQYTNTVFMVEPVNFGFNEETAVNNFFQSKSNETSKTIQERALSEFKGMVSKLRQHGVNVIVLQDTLNPHTPDSIFPNNWISFHENKTVALYPMFAKNRREERREEDVIEILEEKGFEVEQIMDYSSAEDEEIFLEGTGSIILDHVNRIAYAAVSPRTDEELFIEFCEDFEYSPVVFTAYQTVEGERKQIYHTNVMMCVADDYAVICLSALDNKDELKAVTDALKKSGKEIIDITEDQMNKFAGNMLQVGGLGNAKYLVMSQTSYDSLTKEQIAAIEKYNPILSVEISTIETLGGGSARCMIAEVFLPKKK